MSQINQTPAAYADIPPDKAKVIMAAHYAIEQEQYILNDEMGRGAGTLKLLHIAKAEQQIGAEIRYRLQLKVTLNGEEFNAETVVGWEKWVLPVNLNWSHGNFSEGTCSLCTGSFTISLTYIYPIRCGGPGWTPVRMQHERGPYLYDKTGGIRIWQRKPCQMPTRDAHPYDGKTLLPL